LYVVITQAYLLIVLVLRGVGVNLRMAGSGIAPPRLLVLSFALVCLAGAGLLMLPRATPVGVDALTPIDALFTSVSATCVTGLVVRDTGLEFDLFGQAVILVMIQLGGLGIMLFGTVLALLSGRVLGVRESVALGQAVGAETVGSLGRVARFIVAATLAAEAIGAALLYPVFATLPDAAGQPLPPGQAVWHSVFHSVSAFCNAGFSLYGRSLMHGVREGWPTAIRETYAVMGVIAPLIVLGGLGFPVLRDLGRLVRKLVLHLLRRVGKGRPRPTSLDPAGQASGVRLRLSLHSRMVLVTSAVLIVLGAAVLLMVEPTGGELRVIGRVPHAAAGELPGGEGLGTTWLTRVRAAVFQSITARTAGFNTIDMAELSAAGKLWMCALMTIGGSPASTAGGMKTMVVALLALTAWSSLRGRPAVEAFHRTVSHDLVRKAVTLAVLYLLLVLIVTLLLCVEMRGHDLVDLLFEACSACGTVGLSTGVTANLTFSSKIVIIAAMFVGRLGTLTMLLAFSRRMKPVEYAYPGEDVVIG
jgi:trk system potassium uptake protein TrkH